MINFEQELKKFESGLDRKQVEKAIMGGKSEEIKNNPTQQNKVDQIIKRYNLALNYCQTDSYDLAYIQIKKVVRLLPNNVQVQLLAALICIHEGKAEEARQTLNQVLSIDANQKTAKVYMEQLDVKEESVEEAQEKVEEETEEKVKKSKSSVMKTSKTPKAAKAPKKKSAASGSDYEEVTSNKKSFIYLGIGFLVGVIAMFVLVVPTARNSVKNEYVSEADAYKDQITAKDTEIKSLEEELESAQAKTKTAQQEVKKYKNGNQLLIQAAKEYIEGDKAAAAEALIDIDEDILNTDEAKALYDEIKEATFKDAAKTFYENGMNDYNQKDYKSAIKDFKRATKADNSNVNYFYYLARAYEENGQTKSAISVYKQIIEDFPGTNGAKDAQKRMEDLEAAQKSTEKTTENTTEKTTEE